jgi:hypothetical protein
MEVTFMALKSIHLPASVEMADAVPVGIGGGAPDCICGPRKGFQRRAAAGQEGRLRAAPTRELANTDRRALWLQGNQRVREENDCQEFHCRAACFDGRWEMHPKDIYNSLSGSLRDGFPQRRSGQ